MNKVKFLISHPYEEKIKLLKDFVDIEVECEGMKYNGSVTTLPFIQERLEHYQQSGENAGGCYFWSAKTLILKDLRTRTIAGALEDLAQNGDLDKVFKKD
jgi:hypothetical protein